MESSAGPNAGPTRDPAYDRWLQSFTDGGELAAAGKLGDNNQTKKRVDGLT